MRDGPESSFRRHADIIAAPAGHPTPVSPQAAAGASGAGRAEWHDGPMAGTPRFLTLADVAEVLNTSSAQVYALVRRGDLPAIKIGGRGQWRVEAAAARGLHPADVRRDRGRSSTSTRSSDAETDADADAERLSRPRSRASTVDVDALLLAVAHDR